MKSNTLLGLDPVEFMLGQRTGNFSDVLAFAARRAECEEHNDHSVDSTRPTVPAPAE